MPQTPTAPREHDLSKPGFWEALNIPEIRAQVARIRSIQTKRADALAARTQVDQDEIQWTTRTNNLLTSIINIAESTLSRKLSEPGASESSQPATAAPLPPPPYATAGYAPPSLVWKITPETLEYVTFAYGGSTSQKGVPPAVTLTQYTTPEIPFDRLTFIYLWNMWELETNRRMLEALHRPRNAVDLHQVAISINKLGGSARVCSTPSLWKVLAFQLHLLDSQDQDDDDSKKVIEVLQGMQRRLLGPFENFCVLWSRLPAQEKNKRALLHVSKFRYPSVYDLPESNDGAPQKQRADVVEALKNNVEIGLKIEALLKDFCPGEDFQTKINRLITQPTPGAVENKEWEKERAKWIGLIRSSLELYTPGLIPAQAQTQQAPVSGGTGGLSQASAAHAVVNRPFSPEEGLFPPEAVYRANLVVREAMRTVEESRAIQKRQEVHVSQRNEIKRLVVESFSDALYFYRAAALHQLLYSDDNTTMLLLRRATLVLEQFFFITAGRSVYIVDLECALTAHNSLQTVTGEMKARYAAMTREYSAGSDSTITCSASNEGASRARH